MTTVRSVMMHSSIWNSPTKRLGLPAHEVIHQSHHAYVSNKDARHANLDDSVLLLPTGACHVCFGSNNTRQAIETYSITLNRGLRFSGRQTKLSRCLSFLCIFGTILSTVMDMPWAWIDSSCGKQSTHKEKHNQAGITFEGLQGVARMIYLLANIIGNPCQCSNFQGRTCSSFIAEVRMAPQLCFHEKNGGS